MGDDPKTSPDAGLAALDEMHARLIAQHVVLLSLIETHPDRQRLAAQIDWHRQQGIDPMVGMTMTDQTARRISEWMAIYQAAATSLPQT